MSRNILQVILLLIGTAFGQSKDFPVPEIGRGLDLQGSPSNIAPSSALILRDVEIEPGSIRMRPGFTELVAPWDLDRGIHRAFSFYNDVSRETQIMYGVGDEIFINHNDSISRLGFHSRTGDTPQASIYILGSDSVAYFLNCNLMDYFLPYDGSRMHLSIYTSGGDTATFYIYRIIDPHIAMLTTVSAQTYSLEENFDISPVFDTTNVLDFTTWQQRCFISDGTHETLKWDGFSFDRGHFYLDSAIVTSVTYVGNTYINLTFDDVPLARASFDIENYGAYHNAVFYYDSTRQATRFMPIVSLGGYPTANRIHCFGDVYDYQGLREGMKVYITPPVLDGFAFYVDTILTGTVDSMVQYDSLTALVDSVLVQRGIATLGVGVSSLAVDLDSTYLDSLNYQVVISCEAECTSKVAVRINGAKQFTLFRRDAECGSQAVSWIAAGLAAHPTAPRAPLRWSYGGDTLSAGGIGGDGPQYGEIPEPYASVDSFVVVWSPFDYASNRTGACDFALTNVDADSFAVTNGNTSQEINWIIAGRPDDSNKRNEDSMWVQWGLDTIPNGANHKTILFPKRYRYSGKNWAIATSVADTATTYSIYKVNLSGLSDGSGFHLLRTGTSGNTVVRWIAVGLRREVPAAAKVTMVYDHDELNETTFRSDFELNIGPYMFIVTDGPGLNDPWWSQGVPCDLVRDYNDSLVLRVLAPARDFDSTTIALIPDDSSKYAVLKLYQYPPAKFTEVSNGLMYFGATPANPNILHSTTYPYDYNTIYPDPYIEIGTGDGDELVNMTEHYGQLWPYKKFRVYAISGTEIEDFTVRTQDYDRGLWSPGFCLPYGGLDYGVTKSGVFQYDGNQIKIISTPVESFFTDSLNLSQIERVRGTIYEDNLLVSMPTDSSTINNIILVYNIPTQHWSTWNIHAGDFYKEKSPGQLDSLVIAGSDSAATYTFGAASSDNGGQTAFKYKSPYFTFDSPQLLKAVDKIIFGAQLGLGDSIVISFYEDSLTTATYADTIVSLHNSKEWHDYSFTLSAQFMATRIAVEIEALRADTCAIDGYLLKVRPDREIGEK